MRFNITAFALTVGILWGLVMLLVASANFIWPGYGHAFLELVASIYPGYHPGSGIGSIVIGTLYGLIDGAICGLIFAWIYNLFVR